MDRIEKKKWDEYSLNELYTMFIENTYGIISVEQDFDSWKDYFEYQDCRLGNMFFLGKLLLEEACNIPEEIFPIIDKHITCREKMQSYGSDKKFAKILNQAAVIFLDNESKNKIADIIKDGKERQNYVEYLVAGYEEGINKDNKDEGAHVFTRYDEVKNTKEKTVGED